MWDHAPAIPATSLQSASTPATSHGATGCFPRNVQLPGWCDESALTETARAEGLLIEGARWHWSNPQSAPLALVLGYGSINEAAIRTGLQLLGSICQGLDRID
jgi:GntR family transcriptional regulator / MocR family aminotransferase